MALVVEREYPIISPGASSLPVWPSPAHTRIASPKVDDAAHTPHPRPRSRPHAATAGRPPAPSLGRRTRRTLPLHRPHPHPHNENEQRVAHASTSPRVHARIHVALAGSGASTSPRSQLRPAIHAAPYAQHPPPHHPQSGSVRASAPRGPHASALVKPAWHPHLQHRRLRNAVIAPRSIRLLRRRHTRIQGARTPRLRLPHPACARASLRIRTRRSARAHIARCITSAFARVRTLTRASVSTTWRSIRAVPSAVPPPRA
ncbi:hypothetical protein DFH09DRAFT_1301019 [Mycena vulgaris]|nr:hypothetical protein DFH09DRAFT_1301019 [Mycena vulgaris]